VYREAERLTFAEEEQKHIEALEGVDIEDPMIKSALMHADAGQHM
jgi:hypothetical protein